MNNSESSIPFYVHVREYWENIDRRYKSAIAIAFPITLLTFSIFMFHYLYTDHAFRLPGIFPDEQYQVGRWFARFPYWLLGHSNIPVLQQAFSIIFLLGAGVTTLSLWGLRSLTPFGVTLVLLMIAVHPNNLSPFFYTWQTPVFTFSMLLATGGVLIASQENNGGLRIFFTRTLAGGVFICLAMATYQASISVAATVACGYAIIRLVEHKGNMQELIFQHFRPVYSIGISGMLGGIFYAISLKLAGISNTPSTLGGDMIPIADLPQRFIEITLNSFNALWITQPEFHRPIKIALLLMFFFSIRCLAVEIMRLHPGWKKMIAMKCLFLAFLLFSLVLATKFLFFIVTMQSIYIYRYNLSMPFFTAFGIYAIFAITPVRYFGIWRSFAAIAACCIVFLFVRSDLLRQGLLLAGQRHDMAMANRILERIESLPELDFSKRYYLVRLSPYSPERRRMLSTLWPYETAGGGHMDNAEISASWTAESPFKALGSRILFKSVLDNLGGNIKRAQELVKKSKAKRWPDPSSIFVDDDMIVLNM